MLLSWCGYSSFTETKNLIVTSWFCLMDSTILLHVIDIRQQQPNQLDCVFIAMFEYSRPKSCTNLVCFLLKGETRKKGGNESIRAYVQTDKLLGQT